MPNYSDAELVYQIQKEVFERVARESPHALQGLTSGRLALRMKFTTPQAELLISGRSGQLETTCGSTSLQPDFEIVLTANTVHQVMLGKLRLSQAIARGLIKWNGPLWKVPMLTDLFHAAQRVYPTVLKQRGLM